MIEIKDMVVRLPGLDAEGAESLMREIASRIADELSPGVGSRYVENINVHLTLPPGFSRRELIEAVSVSIAKEMK